MASLQVGGFTYVQKRHLGSGQTSQVWLVEAPSKELRALKVVADEASGHREVALLKLCTSPFVIQVYGASLVGQVGFCIVLEEAICDLKALLGRPNRPSTAYLWHGACLALQALHKQNVMWADMKLQNLLWGRDRHVKASDFGGAVVLPVTSSNPMIAATLEILAPELATTKGPERGQKATLASDIWSAGLCRFELEHQQPLWGEGTEPRMVLRALMSRRLPVVPKDLVTQRCLNFSPEQRPTIDSLVEQAALEAAEAGSGCLEEPEPEDGDAGPESDAWSQVPWAQVGLCTAAVAACVGVAAFVAAPVLAASAVGVKCSFVGSVLALLPVPSLCHKDAETPTSGCPW